MKRSYFLLTMICLVFATFTADAQKLNGDSDDTTVRNVQRIKLKGEIAKIFAQKIKDNEDKLAQMDEADALILKEKWYEAIKTENGWYEFDQDEQSRYLQAQVRGDREKYYKRRKQLGKKVATKTGRKLIWNISAPKTKYPPLYDVEYPPFYGDLDKVDFGDDAIAIDVSDLKFPEKATPKEKLALEERFVIKELQRLVKENPDDAPRLRKAYSGIKKAYNFYEQRLTDLNPRDREERVDEDGRPIRNLKPHFEIFNEDGDIFNEDGKVILSDGEFNKEVLAKEIKDFESEFK